VKAQDVIQYDASGKLVSVNLDIKNPNSLEAMEHKAPIELIDKMLTTEQQITQLMEEIKSSLGEKL